MRGGRRAQLLALLAVIAVGAVAGSTYVFFIHTNSGAPALTPLPAWCVRPKGGYLIIADTGGYNNSRYHNVAVGNEIGSWPVINVSRGANVTITVCNTDTTQAHGFQIRYYLDNKTNYVLAGKSMTVSFMATQKGDFAIYCNIFCTVHIFMQSGKLSVT